MQSKSGNNDKQNENRDLPWCCLYLQKGAQTQASVLSVPEASVIEGCAFLFRNPSWSDTDIDPRIGVK